MESGHVVTAAGQYRTPEQTGKMDVNKSTMYPYIALLSKQKCYNIHTLNRNHVCCAKSFSLSLIFLSKDDVFLKMVVVTSQYFVLYEGLLIFSVPLLRMSAVFMFVLSSYLAGQARCCDILLFPQR